LDSCDEVALEELAQELPQQEMGSFLYWMVHQIHRSYEVCEVGVVLSTLIGTGVVMALGSWKGDERHR
jgi:hypothetical protein